jgi:hypothetical protein
LAIAAGISYGDDERERNKKKSPGGHEHHGQNEIKIGLFDWSIYDCATVFLIEGTPRRMCRTVPGA